MLAIELIFGGLHTYNLSVYRLHFFSISGCFLRHFIVWFCLSLKPYLIPSLIKVNLPTIPTNHSLYIFLIVVCCLLYGWISLSCCSWKIVSLRSHCVFSPSHSALSLSWWPCVLYSFCFSIGQHLVCHFYSSSCTINHNYGHTSTGSGAV